MARFSLGREEDESEQVPGSRSSRKCPKRQKTSVSQPPQPPPQQQPPPNHSGSVEDSIFSECESEEEEEEEEGVEESGEGEEEDGEEDEREEEEELDNRQPPQQRPDLNDGAISMTLADPDVLDCPICFDSLTIPVFQCQNGHIACSSCCLKMSQRCPSCSWSIGYNRCRAIEKVLESVRVSCKNMKYGCKQMMKYSERHEHENACALAPCTCPLLDCDFVGSLTVLYSHFSRRHPTSAKGFLFNKFFSVVLEKSQKCLVLREDKESSIFVLNHFSEAQGSSIHVFQIASSPNVGLNYIIVARHGDTSISLRSSMGSCPKWVNSPPGRNFVLVPNYCITASGLLQLDVCIRRIACT